MIATLPVLGAMVVALAQAPAEPPTQRPTSLSPAPASAAPAPAPAAPAPAPAAAAPAPAPEGGALAPWDPSGQGVVAPEPAQPPVPVPVAAPESASTAMAEQSGPPFYNEADLQTFRRQHGLAEPPTQVRKSRWRCLIADPTCGFVVELQATSGYAYRIRQGNVGNADDIYRWSSARVQYDIWLSIPTLVETQGKSRYTRLSLGPKGGIIASDGKEIWGNLGLAGRYWFGRGRFAPALEFTSALSFQVAGINYQKRFDNVRSPFGFQADIGFGLGGFGAIVIGGQFEPGLAREDVPEQARTATNGMFYIGFRGNILWGAPAAIGVATHAAALRGVRSP